MSGMWRPFFFFTTDELFTTHANSQLYPESAWISQGKLQV